MMLMSDAMSSPSNGSEAPRLITEEAYSLPPQLALVDEASPRRAELETFIATKFDQRYRARLTSFMPTLLALKRGGCFEAALGLRRAAQADRLFLEQYIDGPAEEVLAKVLCKSVARESLIEVGNLVSQRGGSSQMLFVALTLLILRLGAEWAVFTATPEVRKLLTRLRLPQHVLGRADGHVLGKDMADWGSYYDTQPEVIAVSARLAERILRRQPLSNLLLNQCQQQMAEYFSGDLL